MFMKLNKHVSCQEPWCLESSQQTDTGQLDLKRLRNFGHICLTEMTRSRLCMKKLYDQIERYNARFTIACQWNNSKKSFNWLTIKELFYAIERKSSVILRPAEFNAATREKIPTTSEQEQLMSLGESKLDRLSPLLAVLPCLSAYITQNIDPRLGLATGSTGTIVGNQFPRDTVFLQSLLKLFTYPLIKLDLRIDFQAYRSISRIIQYLYCCFRVLSK